MYYGFAIYATKIPSLFNQQTSMLNIPGVRDRAIVYVDKVYPVIRFLWLYCMVNNMPCPQCLKVIKRGISKIYVIGDQSFPQ